MTKIEPTFSRVNWLYVRQRIFTFENLFVCRL